MPVAVERRGIRDDKPFERQSWYVLSQVVSAAEAARLICGRCASIEAQGNWVKDGVQGKDRSEIWLKGLGSEV